MFCIYYFEDNFDQNSSEIELYTMNFVSHLVVHPKISSDFFFNRLDPSVACSAAGGTMLEEKLPWKVLEDR
jgi:hypothetical protein